jgi:putative membrane protein
MLDNQPVLIWSFFFGLILASVVTVWKKFRSWQKTYINLVILGGLGAFWLVGLVPVATPTKPGTCFYPAVAICAMILPEFPRSFILVLLGKYQYVLDA